VGAVAMALLIAAIIIEIGGMSSLELIKIAFKNTIGSSYGWGQAIILATPIILTGLSVALCMKMQIWNIGAEGQFFIGAWASAAIGLNFDGPAIIIFPIMFLAAAIAGAAWMTLPAIARAWWNVSEIITTLLLNFVAILFVTYFAVGPWRDKAVGMASASYWVPYELPMLYGNKVHIGILIAIIISILLSLLLDKTKWGFEINIIGRNMRAGAYIGMPVKRLMLIVMLSAGGIAGISGATELLGVAHRLSGFISNDYGYLGIMVATIAAGSPLAVIPVGILLAILLNAGLVLQAQGLSFNAVLAITGSILLFTAIGEAVNRYRLVRVNVDSDEIRKQQKNIDCQGVKNEMEPAEQS